MNSSKSTWDVRDAGGGEYVFLIKPGHPFHTMMFQAYYDGHDTYTLMYGNRMVVCNRIDFVKKDEISTEQLVKYQLTAREEYEKATVADRNLRRTNRETSLQE